METKLRLAKSRDFHDKDKKDGASSDKKDAKPFERKSVRTFDRKDEKPFKKRETRVFDRPAEKMRDNRQDHFLSSVSPNMNVMIRAVQRAGRSLMRDFGEVEHLQVSRKGLADFVSSADMNSERTLREFLKEARPRYGFLTEESGAVTGADTSHRWVIDPLDGTTNFLHGIPFFSVSLALQEDNEIIAGVVMNPATNELFYAEKGCGAWMMTYTGQFRLRVSSRSDLIDAVLGTAIPCPAYGNPVTFGDCLDKAMTQAAGTRCLGSTALDLAYVAAGKFDGYWVEGEKPWDVAAGLLLVKEAGGRVCTPDGDEKVKSVLESKAMMASNDALYAKFAKMLARKKPAAAEPEKA